jgi:multiple sugar transport system permease protein
LVALPLAAFIDRWAPRGRDWLIGAYFAPYITSTVAVAILFSAFFSAEYGLANVLLRVLGGSGNSDWLNRPATLRSAIALVVFWHYVGFNLVLYLAAMKTIPRELYEAAALDRAPPWRQFLHITLPSLRPMVVFALTLSVIGGMQMMEEPFMLTGGHGGVDHAGMTVAFYLYRMAFDFNDFGGAAAMSWLLFVVVGVLTWLTQRLLGPKP